MIHDVNALPCFTALTVTALVLARRFAGEPGRRGWMWGCLAIALAVAVTFVLSGVLFTIALGFGWLSVIALLLLRDQHSWPAPQPERTAAGVP
jgi:4-amino-4-deoxy-L-arabinose transferase-like glycosyltransferase